jgi:HAD superfamily hydrolase (TIGR01509 family)
MKYKYYLFDLDGVLVNTDYIQYFTTKESIIELVNYDISTNEEINNIIKNTIRTVEKLKVLVSKNIITESQIEEVYTLKKKKADIYFSKMSIKNEKIEMMKYLRENECSIAVVTNGNKKSSKLILDNIGVLEYIDILITNEDVKHGKPHEEPYTTAINFFNITNKSEVIIFEDSEIGILSAKKTGCDLYIVKNEKDININLIKKLNNIP